MKVERLDHINIAATPQIIERVRAFYTDVLGLVEGERPPFGSRGHWLYAGSDPIVHLTLRDTTPDADARATGPIDHFALGCRGLAAMLERLEREGIAHRAVDVPGRPQVQIFLRDPAGISLELNFSGEALPAGGHRSGS